MENKYYIIGNTTASQKKLEISEEKWEQISKANLILTNIFAIEQKYDILISNYEDFEKELLARALETALINYTNEEIEQMLISLIKRIMNLLLSIKFFVEQLDKKHLSKIPIDIEANDYLKSILKTSIYDLNEYKFLKNIRDYVTHRGLPLDLITIDAEWERNEDSEKSRLGRFIIPYADKNRLSLDKKISKSVLNQVQNNKGKIDLRYPFRKVIGKISNFNILFREKIESELEFSKRIIKQIAIEFSDFSNYDLDFGKVIHERNSSIIAVIYFSLKDLDRIDRYYKRNSSQGLLEKIYIHNRI